MVRLDVFSCICFKETLLTLDSIDSYVGDVLLCRLCFCCTHNCNCVFVVVVVVVAVAVVVAILVAVVVSWLSLC